MINNIECLFSNKHTSQKNKTIFTTNKFCGLVIGDLWKVFYKKNQKNLHWI